MEINSTNLATLRRAFNAAFNQGLGAAAPMHTQIATVVPSTTGTEEYGWLGDLPGLREWVGDRVIHGIRNHGYAIKNKEFELTVAVPRPSIRDDAYGIYSPMMSHMGQSAAVHPDELVGALLKAGPSTLCYDGQYFLDTDHPVVAADGTTANVANWDNNSGSGTPWYLLDTSRFLKPLILQNREAPRFVSLTNENDPSVFFKNEYVYGVSCSRNVGFGFWQMVYGSRKTLDATNLGTAFAAMGEFKADGGRKLGVRPNVLVVPPSLEFTAKALVAQTVATGGENPLAGVVKVITTAWVS